MSRVLVAYASKHGATAEIADAIADQLREAGHATDCMPTEPANVVRRAERLGARDHVVFNGRLPVEPGNFIERKMVEACPPEHRDLRDWDAIRRWATAIAAELAKQPVADRGR